jgi:hypothetical protein
VILAVIVACEIGFWVLIALGLSARYLLRWRRTGAVLLALTPVADLVLLIATALDLRAGATAHITHALAALYLGFSLAYGHKMIRWADARFAHRFAGGPAPVKRHGMAYVKECWRDVLRTTIAVAVASGVLWLLIVLAGDPARTAELDAMFRVLRIIFLIEIGWAVINTIWPKKPAPLSPR